MSGHQQTAQEALWPFGPLARPSYEAQQQLERVAAALAAAEQRGRDGLIRRIEEAFHDGLPRTEDDWRRFARRIRAALEGE